MRLVCDCDKHKYQREEETCDHTVDYELAVLCGGELNESFNNVDGVGVYFVIHLLQNHHDHEIKVKQCV